jgi:hypothetical protein
MAMRHFRPVMKGVHMKGVAGIALLLAFVALPALAKKPEVEPAVNASNKDGFETVAAWVRGQMKEGGRYAHVSATERTRVDTRLGEMEGMFQKTPAVDQMSDDDKLKLFNYQEEVNAILAERDSERLICKNVKPIGSNIPVKQCVTAGELEARRRNDVDYLRKTQDMRNLKGTSR